MDIVERGLRRRIHMLEQHNQHFEQCESAWCHPSADNDPARLLGEPEKWPFSTDPAEIAALLDGMTTQEIAKAMELLPSDVLEWAVEFEMLGRSEKG